MLELAYCNESKWFWKIEKCLTVGYVCLQNLDLMDKDLDMMEQFQANKEGKHQQPNTLMNHIK